MTMYGEDVRAIWHQGILTGGVHGDRGVGRSKTGRRGGQNSVDVNFTAFIVKYIEDQIGPVAFRNLTQCERPAHPNIGSVPSGTNNRIRRVGGSETRVTGLPI